MRAGRMNRRVQVQAPTVVDDGNGGTYLTYAVVATRWASVEPMAGRELYEAQQVDARATVRIRMRYDPSIGLTPRHRLVLTNART